MNYEIIKDPQALMDFINWLPDLEPHECYYIALFARKKYHFSAKNDKTQCKRLTATSKEWLIRKIRQLECPIGTYVNKDGSRIHEDSLALYISINPRSLPSAQKVLIKKLADTLSENLTHLNPSSLAMSSIQKSKSRTVFVDFDFDEVEFESISYLFKGQINKEAYFRIKTRGGFHLMVSPSKVHEKYKKTWYNYIASFASCDVKGDNLIPVPGCTQGGFTPILITD